MATMEVNIRKARENFSEIVNRVELKGERIILTSRNNPKAVIVCLKDAEILEDKSMSKAKGLFQLERIKKVRERLLQKGIKSDSLSTLRRIREERVEN